MLTQENSVWSTSHSQVFRGRSFSDLGEEAEAFARMMFQTNPTRENMFTMMTFFLTIYLCYIPLFPIFGRYQCWTPFLSSAHRAPKHPFLHLSPLWLSDVHTLVRDHCADFGAIGLKVDRQSGSRAVSVGFMPKATNECWGFRVGLKNHQGPPGICLIIIAGTAG